MSVRRLVLFQKRRYAAGATDVPPQYAAKLAFLRNNQPISKAEFAAAMRPIMAKARSKRYAVPVNGTSSSFLLCHYLKELVGADNIATITIDHFPEDAGRAAAITRQLKQIGIQNIFVVDPDFSSQLVVTSQRALILSGSTSNNSNNNSNNSNNSNNNSNAAETRPPERLDNERLLEQLAREAVVQNFPTLIMTTPLEEHTAETMRRLIRQSGIDGLSGRRIYFPTAGLFGWYGSHVDVGRPLLVFSEDRLRASAESLGIEWVPKPTLASDEKWDLALGTSQQDLVPGTELDSLNKYSLALFTERMSHHRIRIEAKVLPYITKYTMTDPPTGTAYLNLSMAPGQKRHWLSNGLVAQRVISYLARWTTPSLSTTSTAAIVSAWRQLIEAATKPVKMKLSRNPWGEFQVQEQRKVAENSGGKRPTISVGHSIISPPVRRLAKNIWFFSRAPMAVKSSESGMRQQFIPVDITQQNLVLWDNRFHVRLGAPKPPSSHSLVTSLDPAKLGLDTEKLRYVIRGLTAADVVQIQTRFKLGVPTPEMTFVKNTLANVVLKVPQKSLSTIPVIALRQDDGDCSYVVAVPSLGLLLEPNLLSVEIKFLRQSMLEQQQVQVGFEVSDDVIAASREQ
ncbi:uncharacterized protein BJ171DRAFT_598054 [Polychytrium aggregatum]|uniref:uncharacterized protein n=1 Tax=Polychytrium aggregatum TaxID=110093 RepID=UPI0022FEFCEE|nr:uncharacterized protein BJ171DRAFT_598054 [Polychytrium aggregatum]KAI9205861.1 hypothetical protein BJ171DRAFT_598054 [Polychytrium aggregatum]